MKNIIIAIALLLSFPSLASAQTAFRANQVVSNPTIAGLVVSTGLSTSTLSASSTPTVQTMNFASTTGTSMFAGAVSSATTIGAVTSVSGGNTTISGSGLSTFGGNVRFVGTGNGVATLRNASDNDWSRLTFGGTTSAFPAIGKSGNNISVLSADGTFQANLVVGTSTASAKLSIQNSFGSTTPLFDIATTTSSAFATSSLFSIKANGDLTAGSFSYTQSNGTANVTGSLGVAGRLTVQSGSLSSTNVGMFSGSGRSFEVWADGVTGRGLFVQTGTGNLGLGTTTPNSTLSVVGTTTVNTRLVLPPTATAGIQLFNTGDNDGLATNERIGMYWSGNMFNIATERSGGTSRAILIGATDGTIGSGRNALRIFPRGTTAGTAGLFDFTNSSTISAVGTYFMSISNPGGSGWTTSSGDNRMLNITPIYGTTGTSQNTDLFIQRTETTTGSGEQNLIKAGTSTNAGMFVVRNTGLIGLGTSTLASNSLVTIDGSTNSSAIALNVRDTSSVYNAGQLRLTASSTSYTDFFQGGLTGNDALSINVAGVTNNRLNLIFNNSATSYFDTVGWAIQNGGTGNTQIAISRTANQMSFKNAFNANRAVIGTNGTVDAPGMVELYGVDNAKKVSINATSTSYISNGANFGLGTTTPSNALEVAGSAYFAGTVTATSTATSTFTGAVRAGGYVSSDGSVGFTGTCTILGLTSITVKNGLITGCI
jgi:hypothetical protein